MTEVDTRRLTRHIRERGAMRGVIAEGERAHRRVRAAAAGLTIDGRARSRVPSDARRASYAQGEGPLVVAFDYGIKRNIVRMLEATGFRVEVVPAATTADAGAGAATRTGSSSPMVPGDPAAVDYARRTIRTLADTGLPTFGICLGHQLLGLAFGGETAKLPYGHRGGNHPVQDWRPARC